MKCPKCGKTPSVIMDDPPKCPFCRVELVSGESIPVMQKIKSILPKKETIIKSAPKTAYVKPTVYEQPTVYNTEENKVEVNQERKLSGGLIVGIVLLPIVFAWFTLGQGYSIASRVGAFIYLGFSFFMSLFILPVICATMGMAMVSAQSNSNNITYTEPAKEIEPIKIKLKSLMSQYEKNEVRADSKYKGNLISTGGYVDKVGKNFMGDMTLTLKPTRVKYSFKGMRITVGDRHREAMLKLDKGQWIDITCFVKGYIMTSVSCEM